MSRAITPEGLQALFAEETADAFISLCKIDHAMLSAGPIYLAANTVDVSYGGNVYVACPFEMVLAADTDESVPAAQFRIDNVDRRISDAARVINSPATFTFWVVRIPPDNSVHLELGPLDFSLRQVSVTSLTVEGTLGYNTDFLNEPAVKDRFDPTIAPALFA